MATETKAQGRRSGLSQSVILVVLAFMGVVASFTYNCLSLKPMPYQPTEADLAARHIDIDSHALATTLSRIIQLRTVSNAAYSESLHLPPEAAEETLRVHEVLKEAFPLVHARLKMTLINTYSLLYEWTGSDPELKPMLLMAHTDVVPVEPGTEEQWLYPPFSGAIAEGYVWGRGAIDIKMQVVTILGALERLLEEGFEPKRTIFAAFGHDEEVGGLFGAKRIVEHLQERGVRLDVVVDEAGFVGKGMCIIPGLDPNITIAAIGTAEKGYASVELVAEVTGGHSAIPDPKGNALTVIAEAVNRLQRNQMPLMWQSPVPETFRVLAPYFSFWQRFAFANAHVLQPLLLRGLAADASSNAMVRTTAAPTMFQAGVKENVVPAKARAVVNFRLIQGTSVADVVAHVQKQVNDDRVKISLLPEGIGPTEPSPVTPTTGPQYEAIESAIRRVYGFDVVTVPMIVRGATDSRHYIPICDRVFRFTAINATIDDMKTIHGKNERISVRNLESGVLFYRQFIQLLQ
eukprot:jgi/Chlat1/2605/Chrsp178S02462